MPPSNKILIPNFSGMITSVDDSVVGIRGATNVENFTIQAGKLLGVEGTTKIANNNIGASTNIIGMNYIRGICSDSSLTEKIIIFSQRPSGVSAHLFDAAGTSPSFSTSAISFTPAPTMSSNEWQSVVFDDKIIATNTTQVYQGDICGLSTMYPGNGYVPIVGLQSSISIQNSTSVPFSADWLGFTTTVPTNTLLSPILNKISFKTGIATENLLKDCIMPGGNGLTGDAGPTAYYVKANSGTIRFGAYNNYGIGPVEVARASGPFTITLYTDDMINNSRTNFTNWQFRDRVYFFFSVKESYSTDWNNTTAKTVFDASKFAIKLVDRNNKEMVLDVASQTIIKQNDDTYAVCGYQNNKSRYSSSVFDYTKIYKVIITGNVSFGFGGNLGLPPKAQATKNYFDFTPAIMGGVDLTLTLPDRSRDRFINFGEVRYTTSTGQISDVHNLFTLTNNTMINGGVLGGIYNQLPTVGNWLTITFPTGGATGTESWLVVNDGQSPSSWRKVGVGTNTGSAGIATDNYFYNVTDLLSKPTVTPTNIDITNANCLCSFNGSMVYGLKRAVDNIRMSQIGNPFVLKTTSEQPGRLTNPGDYTLSESYSDFPIAMAGLLDTLVVFGQEGVYASSGQYPSQMSSFKKLPNLPGICGRFAYAKYKDPQLGNGVIYVSRTADRAFFLYVDASSFTPQYKAIEMTESIRGTFKQYLTATSTDISKIRVAYREDIDEINICNGKEMWRWLQPDLLTNKRPIVKRTLADPVARFNFISYPINASGTLLPMIASTGIGTTQCLMKFDNTNYLDHTSTITGNYVTGKLFSTNSSRIIDVWVDKINRGCTVGVAVTSDRQSDFKTIPFNLNTCHINFKAQGYQHQVGLAQTNSVQTGLNNFWLEVTSNLATQVNTRNI